MHKMFGLFNLLCHGAFIFLIKGEKDKIVVWSIVTDVATETHGASELDETLQPSQICD